ncbi:unnamed protein product [Ixodes hexagonus]
MLTICGGVSAGLHFPAMSSIIVSHLRPQDRTFFTSVVAAGPSCGLLFIGSVGSIAMVSHGWPIVFKLTGMLGIGWCFGLAYLMHHHGAQPSRPLKATPKVMGAPAFQVPWIVYFRSPAFCYSRSRLMLVVLVVCIHSIHNSRHNSSLTQGPQCVSGRHLGIRKAIRVQPSSALSPGARIESEGRSPLQSVTPSCSFVYLFMLLCGEVILLAHFTENNSYFILISWLPTYFHERFPDAQMWVFNMVPWVITPICSIGGGTVADYLIRRGHPVSRVRKLLEMACQLSKAILLPLVPMCGYVGALMCVTLAVASSGFHNSGVFINPQDIAPLHAGSVFGLMNTVGAIPGVVGVYLVGYVVDATHSWALIFYTTALLNVMGCGFFLTFGRGHPIVS